MIGFVGFPLKKCISVVECYIVQFLGEFVNKFRNSQMCRPLMQVSGNPNPLFHTRHLTVLNKMVWSMGDGKNLILLRTAIFLLKDLRRRCQECLQALIIPRHLEDHLKLIIFSANTKSSQQL